MPTILFLFQTNPSSFCVFLYVVLLSFFRCNICDLCGDALFCLFTWFILAALNSLATHDLFVIRFTSPRHWVQEGYRCLFSGLNNKCDSSNKNVPGHSVYCIGFGHGKNGTFGEFGLKGGAGSDIISIDDSDDDFAVPIAKKLPASVPDPGNYNTNGLL
jgi:hypothetical protein